MYVFCVGMYRSCSTWQYNIVSHLLERHRDGKRLGFLTGEAFGLYDQQKVDGPAWQSLKAHDGHPYFAQAIAEQRALAVYSYRDLRDVAYSLIHIWCSTFDEIVLRQQQIQLCLESDRFWTAQPNVLCQRYETLIDDPVQGVKELAAYLDISLAAAEATAIAEEYSMPLNLRRSEAFAHRLQAEGIEIGCPESTVRHDPHTLLHWNHIRNGRIGSWREQATPVQMAILANLCNAWLIERGYEKDNTWALEVLGALEGEMAAARQRVVEIQKQWAPYQERLAHLEHLLEETSQRLAALESLGPVALGLASRLHQTALRYPRTTATIKRLIPKQVFRHWRAHGHAHGNGNDPGGRMRSYYPGMKDTPTNP